MSHTPDRREFLRGTATGIAVSAIPLFATPKLATAAPTKKSAAETAVKALYDSMTDKQKKEVCFAWDYEDKNRGLLRTHVSNNWQITKPTISSPFYTKDQQGIVHDIFKGLINPEWYDRFITQLKDDNNGKPFGSFQSIAIFGEPGSDQFEFVMTGRHQTLRADGNTEKHVAFGGPIFYGHAAETFNESDNHKGNVFWPQAIAANNLYKLLDDKQQKQALLSNSPKESLVAFRGADVPPSKGLPIKSLSGDQKKEIQKVLAALIDPFRTEDQDEVKAALKAQGGLDSCVLSFFSDSDIAGDKVWDNWRLEGPSFVWYFRGNPHVHVWVNVASSAEVKLNARG